MKLVNIMLIMTLVIWICTANVLANPNSSKGFLLYSEEEQQQEKEELEKAEEQENNNTQTTIKSTDNYLKKLEVEGYVLTPEFDKQTINYEIIEKVKDDFLEIKAETDDEKASISGIGKVMLNSGENNLKIEVTAESGTVRTYFIKVVKETKDNLRLTDIYLKTNGNKIDLDSDFNSEKFEYYCNVSNDISKIDIEAISNIENAKVEVNGNDGLKEGMNQIFISISTDGVEKTTYKINVYKEMKQTESSKNKYKNIMILVICIIIIILVNISLKKEKNIKGIIE